MPAFVSRRQPVLAVIGVGAFGRLAVQALKPHFRVRVHDRRADLAAIAAELGVEPCRLEDVAGADIVLLAVPWRALAEIGGVIAGHLRPGTLVVDVSSIKAQPLATLRAVLPADVELVGTHPLFGPRSARSGLGGQRIALCGGTGRGARRVRAFLSHVLDLRVVETTAEEHDRQMAYVQAVSHLVVRALKAIAPPVGDLSTATFDHLMAAVDLVGGDSDAVLTTVLADNPHAAGVVAAFLDAAADQVRRSARPAPEPIREVVSRG